MATLGEWAQPVVDPEVRAYVGSLVSAVRLFKHLNGLRKDGNLQRHLARRKQCRGDWPLCVRRRCAGVLKGLEKMAQIL